MIAASSTNWIDIIKVRLQLQGEGMNEKVQGRVKYYKGFIPGVIKICKEEGFKAAFTKGLPASLMREGSYSSIRLGTYETFKEVYGATDPNNTPLYKKILAGGTSGTIGSFIANPTDLVKVRMQADITKPGIPPRYKNTFQAFSEI